MALRLSTQARNYLCDHKATATHLMTATTISFGDGDGTDGRDTINDSGSGLGDFNVREKLTIAGSTDNDGTYEILSVAAGTIEIAADSLTTEAAGDQVILAAASGGSFADIFRNGVMDIYSGAQPSNADAGETGTKLVSITLGSGSFTGGTATNGINFGESNNGVLAKEAGEVWSGVGLTDGTAGWFRFYANDYTTGASTTAVRFDGNVATSGADLNMSNTAVDDGGTVTIDSVSLTQPAS